MTWSKKIVLDWEQEMLLFQNVIVQTIGNEENFVFGCVLLFRPLKPERNFVFGCVLNFFPRNIRHHKKSSKRNESYIILRTFQSKFERHSKKYHKLLKYLKIVQSATLWVGRESNLNPLVQ